MSHDSTRKHGKQRLVLLVIALVGLLLSGLAIFISQASKKQLADSKTETTISTRPTDNLPTEPGATSTNITSITVADAATENIANQEPVKKATKRRNFRNSNKNRIAAVIPEFEPPRNPKDVDLQQPRGVVEMWAADKRTFVSVPPGSKFED